MKVVVFTGMSITFEEANEFLKAEYRGPVKRGDLPALAKDVTHVGIIDGIFFGESSVGHREIIELMKRGVTVVGGGSMGALRASELHELGMIGAGRIFEMYRDGLIEGDDEVAVVFDPETYEPLSEPLVNIRYFLSVAVKREILEVDQEEAIIEKMRAVYYPHRSFHAMMDRASEIVNSEVLADLRKLLGSASFDLKRMDAIDVLNSLKRLSGPSAKNEKISF